jgi:DNA processing protein
MDWTSQELAWLGLWTAWSYAPAAFSKVRSRFACACEAAQAGDAALEALGLGAAQARQIGALRGEDWAARGRAALLGLGEEMWLAPTSAPELARALAPMRSAPPYVYGWGARGLLRGCPEQAAAVVGSRRVDQAGRAQTRLLTRALVGQGCVIVSGGALGVDTEAHEAALEAGGQTVAILGTALDRLYPASNKALFQQMARGGRGLVLSPFVMGQGGHRHHFPKRNELIAAMTRLTLVTRAREGSGSLLTAQAAMRYGRCVAVTPADISLPEGRGSNALLESGARPLIGVEGVPKLWAEASGQTPGQTLEPTQGALFAAPATLRLRGAAWVVGRLLAQRGGRVDELVRASGLGSGQVAAALTELELLNAARREVGGVYRWIAAAAPGEAEI